MQKTKIKEQNTTYDMNKFVNNHMYVLRNMKELNSIADAWALSVRKYATCTAMKDDYTGLRLTYKEAYEKADIVVFLVNHREFSELNYREEVQVLDFCGVFKK